MYLFLQSSSLYLLYISTIAGLATTAGCLLVLFLGHPPEQMLAVLLAGAGGIMLAVVALDLIPIALSYSQPASFLGGLLLGIMIMFAADKLLGQKYKNGAPDNRQNRIKKIGILIAAGIALHDIPEGMAITAGQESTAKLGMLIALGIALHNLPEGMATATPLLMAGVDRKKILGLTLGISFFTPLGAILGKAALTAAHTSLCLLVSLAAGAMTFLVLAELWPLSREHHPHWAMFGAGAGFIFFAFVSTLLPG